MNPNHLTAVCKYFALGATTKEPIRVHGGLLHIMWRVHTSKGSYAIKQLSRYIDLRDEAIVNNYNLTEQIAARFAKHGIPAVSAIEKDGQYLYIIDDTGFLIYPWVEAKALEGDQVSEKHALQIPKILAAMHSINLDVPEISAPEFDAHTNDAILELINKAQQANCSFAEDLIENKANIVAANDAYQNAIAILKKHVVVSHGDLDQKNVLWDKHNNPILIDWESARKLNPVYEIVNASLDWSGITTNFNKALFSKMMRAYQDAGGIIEQSFFEAAFHGVLGNWINWMVYNISRTCDEPEEEQRNVGIQQVGQGLSTILRLQKIIPELMKVVDYLGLAENGQKH